MQTDTPACGLNRPLAGKPACRNARLPKSSRDGGQALWRAGTGCYNLQQDAIDEEMIDIAMAEEAEKEYKEGKEKKEQQ